MTTEPNATIAPDEKKFTDAFSVLIIDDVPANIQVLAEALSGEYKLKVATTGAEGLAVAAQARPDLILLDIMMPEMNGFDVCRALKNNPATQGIPVIFVTARDAHDDEEEGLNLGAVDYISKPFHLPIVRARVRNHLNLKRRADLLEELAHVDSLTGIANRRRFDEVLEVELRRCQRNNSPMSLLLVDVDQFKNYNDHFGHGMGDVCLTKVARALANGLSRAGDVVARYGGEEFGVIIPGGDLANARQVAERLRQAVIDLAIPQSPEAANELITISIGVASRVPDGTTTGTTFIHGADLQLYAAKAAGRNQVAG